MYIVIVAYIGIR